MSGSADTAKSPPTTGGRPRTCPTCNRLFQNSRGYHKHTLKCIRGQKAEAAAAGLGGEKAAEGEVQQQLNEPQQNHYPAMEQGVDALEEKDRVDLEGDSVRKSLEGDVVVRKVGSGRGRRGRMRSLSATSVPSGLSERGEKSHSASTSPAGTPSVQTRSRSYRGAHGIGTEAGLRRKRGWHKGPEESDRKRRSLTLGDQALLGSEGGLPKKTMEHEGSRRGRRGWRGRGRPPKYARRIDRGVGMGRGGPIHESMEHGIEYVRMESEPLAAGAAAQGLGSPPLVTSPSARSPAVGSQSGGPVFPMQKYLLLSGGASDNTAGGTLDPVSPQMNVSPISASPTSPPIRSPVLSPMHHGQSDSDAGVGTTASTPASDGGRKAIGEEKQTDGKSETHKTSASDLQKKSPTRHHGDRGKWKERYMQGRMAAERKHDGREGEESAPASVAADGVAGRHPPPVLTVGAALSMSPSLLGSMENRTLGFSPEQGYGLQAAKPEGKSLERSSSSAPGSNASPAMSPVSGLGDQSPPSHPLPEQQSCPTSPSAEVPPAQAIMAGDMHLKTLPEGANFSVPLNQGPSMAAQSATYFLSGTPPVQGLEFMGQPPTTPHTQVFAFYPSDTLFRPKSSVVDSTPATTNIATDSVSVEAPPTITSSMVVQPPPPPPLIPASSYQRGGAYSMVGDSSLPTTSTMRPMVMQQPVAPGKGQYVSYSTIPQNSAGMLEAMHSRQPMYQSFVLHSGHHPAHGVVHPLSQGMRAAPNMSSDIGYFSQFGYRTDAATRTTSTVERATPTSSQTPPTANQVGMSDVQHGLQYTAPVPMVDGQTEFQCMQCDKFFKNKKALNGHMRKHGGAHGHKSAIIKREPVDMSNGEPDVDTHGPHYPMDHVSHHHPPMGHHASSRVFTFSNAPQTMVQPARSMDALLEAAEQMRQREEEEQQKRDAAAVVLASGVSHLPPRKRPENISIPGSTVAEHDRARRRRSMSPPLMSPRPSIYYNILSPKSSQPSTPGIRNRQSFDKDEEPPMIHIGKEYQAEVEDYCTGADPLEEKSREDPMWKPVEGPSEQEELIMDWYMEFACSEAIPYKGRNKEYALHVLQAVNYNIKAAVHALVMGKTAFNEDSPLADYHYAGTSEWRPMEAKLFRRGFREHKKRFDIIQKDISGKSVNELHEYYYMWKKMKPAEYRGRQRHHSDDDLSYERLLGLDAYGPDDAFTEEGPNSPSSVDSGSSGSCSLSDERESVDSRARRFKGAHQRVAERRYTPDITAQSKNPYEKHWEPLQQREGGSLLGEGKFHFESPSKSTKISSLAKESKSSGSPGTSDSPKRQKINTKTAEDRPGNYPCGFCGITFPSVKSRSAHMKKHKYEDAPQSHGQSTTGKK